MKSQNALHLPTATFEAKNETGFQKNFLLIAPAEFAQIAKRKATADPIVCGGKMPWYYFSKHRLLNPKDIFLGFPSPSFPASQGRGPCETPELGVQVPCLLEYKTHPWRGCALPPGGDAVRASFWPLGVAPQPDTAACKKQPIPMRHGLLFTFKYRFGITDACLPLSGRTDQIRGTELRHRLGVAQQTDKYRRMHVLAYHCSLIPGTIQTSKQGGTAMKLLTERIKEFSSYLAREEKSAATQEKYLRDVRSFGVYAEDQDITRELVISWKKSLITSGYAVRSINSMLASINSFLDFMGLSDCKTKSIKVQRQTYCTEDQELTKSEYLRLLAASAGKEQLNLVIQTICGTGIRVSELRYFTVEAVRQGEITVECKNKTRTILVPGKLRSVLLNYAKRCGIVDGVIFITRAGKPLDRSNIWLAMKKLCEAAGVKPSKVFPHNLRKLFARTFYGIEKDIAKLADILGHSSINTTRIYIISTGTEHRQKIERLGLVI